VEAGFRYWLESQGLANDTVRNYEYAARVWNAWCDDNELDPLHPDRQDLRAYIGFLLQSRSHGNAELLKIGLRRYFSYLEDTGQHPGPNPVKDLPLRKRETEPAEPFTRDELARMYVACQNHQERAVFLLLMGGGLRRSEVYGITREDVHLDSGTIRVLGKGHQYRWIAPGRAVVEATWQAMEFSPRLCPQSSPEVVWRIVKQLARRANVRGRIYPHRFRHSYAVSFLEQGGKIEDLMHVLGHRRIEMSLYYARARAKRRALEAQATINVAERLLDLPALTPAPSAAAVAAAPL
jgi:integrase/recombinase XerD